MVFEVLAVAIWVMLPAYVPNNVAVLAGGGRPIDGGKTWRDGNRLLGDGKTWRGTLVGILAGFLLALALNYLEPAATGALGIDLPTFPVAAALALPAGALLGDMAASFVKRRTGRERGASFPGLDQLDFVIVALPLAALAAWNWFVAVVTLPVLFVILVVTPILHIGTNVIGYLIGVNREPW